MHCNIRVCCRKAPLNGEIRPKADIEFRFGHQAYLKHSLSRTGPAELPSFSAMVPRALKLVVGIVKLEYRHTPVSASVLLVWTSSP